MSAQQNGSASKLFSAALDSDHSAYEQIPHHRPRLCLVSALCFALQLDQRGFEATRWRRRGPDARFPLARRRARLCLVQGALIALQTRYSSHWLTHSQTAVDIVNGSLCRDKPDRGQLPVQEFDIRKKIDRR